MQLSRVWVQRKAVGSGTSGRGKRTLNILLSKLNHVLSCIMNLCSNLGHPGLSLPFPGCNIPVKL